MTVMELMCSELGQVGIAEMMHARFGCPGKEYPCIAKYTTGPKVCEGCWVNFFNTQVPEVIGGANETA